MIESPAEFRLELEKLNPHWLTGMPKEEDRFPRHRDELEALYSDRDLNKVSVVTGPRRAGKTVLLRHLVARLIRDGVDPRNLLYCSLDNSRLAMMCDDLVRDATDLWLEGIATEGPRYLLLDEVHLLDGWYSAVKNLHDLGGDLKIYVSGSASLAIQVKAEQYLRGRYVLHEVWPLDFAGYLRIIAGAGKGEVAGGRDDRGGKGRPEDALAADRQRADLTPGFRNYMLVGGFPESLEVKDTGRWFELLVNMVAQKAVYTDVAATFNIRAVKVLDSVLHYIVQNQSRLLTYESINSVAGLKHEVLLDYIEYLKASYLVVEVRKLAPTVREQLRSRKKYLCADQGLRNALLAEYEVREDNEGFIAENVVGMHLHLAAARSGRGVFYSVRGADIDYVVVGEVPVLVEVKYQNRIGIDDIAKVRRAMDATGARLAYLVSKRDFDVLRDGDREIRVVPAAVFCRWVGEYLSLDQGVPGEG
jgi:predicted AAA+ superfamily ATPase